MKYLTRLFRFYRMDFCIRNLGLGIIALLSLDSLPKPASAVVVLLQLLLIQMHSFSMNDYFDFKVWGEENYIGVLLRDGMNEKTAVILTILPLLMIGLTAFFNSSYLWLLAVYAALFFFYQAPFARLKDNYLLSILVNSLCLGLILYVFPFLSLAKGFTLTAGVFSVIFFFYLAFHEVIHQIAHFGRDKIYSLPRAIGIKKSVRVAEAFLIIPLFAALIAVAINPFRYFFFTGTIIFSSLRAYVLQKTEPIQENFIKLRERNDKFYSFQEGLYYLFFLSLGHIARG